jgi:alcohol dehydrogenase class IV
MRFEFASAGRVVFGAGVLREAGPIARSMGSRALVVTGRQADRAEPLLADLRAQGVGVATYSLAGEPTTGIVRQATQEAREAACDLVMGIGGGSVLDTGKAIAALLANGGDPLDYMEVVGHGKPLTLPSRPFIAIPTTAGTGTEVTRNAVLASTEHRVKASMRSPLMLPALALVDPTLTYTLPPEVTASTGMDALTQLIEPYVSVRANPLTDALCLDGMARVARSLRVACDQGGDAAAREDMALASLFGGFALANAGLGAAHGFAGPIGGMFQAPHGALCAALLPRVMAVNLRALQDRRPASPVLERFETVARILTGRTDARAADGIRWVEALCADLGVPPLSTYGILAPDIEVLVGMAGAASSTKGNPIVLTPGELREILSLAL